MSKERMLAALPLAALCGALALTLPNPASAGQEGMIVVRDAQTGQLRAPTLDEMKALAPAPTAGLQAAVPLESLVVTRSDGSRVLRLAERGLVYLAATRDASGKLVEQCIHGSDRAAQMLSQPTPTARELKEHRHEDR